MKNKIKYLVCAGLLSLTMQGQKAPSSVTNADKDYDRYDYIDAVKTYEKAFSKGFKC